VVNGHRLNWDGPAMPSANGWHSGEIVKLADVGCTSEPKNC